MTEQLGLELRSEEQRAVDRWLGSVPEAQRGPAWKALVLSSEARAAAIARLYGYRQTVASLSAEATFTRDEILGDLALLIGDGPEDA